MNRWPDWWNQAQRDLGHAKNAVADGDFEWSAFAAQQAAEKAVKALVFSLGGEPWGHVVSMLLGTLPAEHEADVNVREAAMRLDKHYLPARYPNGFAAGHPGMYYTRGEAERAIEDATAIVEFCRSHLPRS